MRKLQCRECNAALSLAFRYSFPLLIVVAVLIILGIPPLVRFLFPGFSGIPFGLAVIFVLVFFVLLKGIIYLCADWQIKETGST